MITLWHGDCLELMKNIPDKSIDMVLTDPPYGTTACKWDVIIPFDPMWNELRRITKDNGAICLFGNEPFSSLLRCSNIKGYKYEWYWKKNHATGHLNAKKRPMKITETISIFNTLKYFPQGLQKVYWEVSNSDSHCQRGGDNKTSTVSGGLKKNYKQTATGYPRDMLEFDSCNGNKEHPTQKPVALLEYLIKTYTLENETVLDFTAGSGSTGVACQNLNRSFIGIEKDDKYFEIAKNRIFPHPQDR